MRIDFKLIRGAVPENVRRLAVALGLPPNAPRSDIVKACNAHHEKPCGWPCTPDDGLCGLCAVRFNVPKSGWM